MRSPSRAARRRWRGSTSGPVQFNASPRPARSVARIPMPPAPSQSMRSIPVSCSCRRACSSASAIVASGGKLQRSTRSVPAVASRASRHRLTRPPQPRLCCARPTKACTIEVATPSISGSSSAALKGFENSNSSCSSMRQPLLADRCEGPGALQASARVRPTSSRRISVCGSRSIAGGQLRAQRPAMHLQSRHDLGVRLQQDLGTGAAGHELWIAAHIIDQREHLRRRAGNQCRVVSGVSRRAVWSIAPADSTSAGTMAAWRNRTHHND